MSGAVAEFEGVLSLRDQMTGKVDQAVKHGSGQLNKLAAAGKKVAIGFGLVGTAILTSSLGIAKHWANIGDEIAKTSVRTGFATETISAYRHGLELSGASLADFETANQRMSRTLQDLQREIDAATAAGIGIDQANSKNITSFRLLGISIDELLSLSPEKRFERIGLALASIKDEALRTALTMDIFGRSGTNLLPFFSQGAEGLRLMREETKRLGLEFDLKAAQKAEKFNDALTTLKASMQGVVIALGPIIADIALKLLPEVEKTIVGFRQWMEENENLIGSIIEWGVYIGGAGVAVGLILPTLTLLAESLTILTGLFGGLKLIGAAAGIAGVGKAATVATSAIGGATVAGGAAGGAGAAGAAVGGGLVGSIALLAAKLNLLVGVTALSGFALYKWGEQAKGLITDLIDMQLGTEANVATNQRMIDKLREAGVAVDESQFKFMSMAEQIEYLRGLMDANIGTVRANAEENRVLGEKVAGANETLDALTQAYLEQIDPSFAARDASYGYRDAAQAAGDTSNIVRGQLGSLTDAYYGVRNAALAAADAQRQAGIQGYADGGIVQGFAQGGLVQALASGGRARIRNILVGERGPELMTVPVGSHVAPAPRSESILREVVGRLTSMRTEQAERRESRSGDVFAPVVNVNGAKDPRDFADELYDQWERRFVQRKKQAGFSRGVLYGGAI